MARLEGERKRQPTKRRQPERDMLNRRWRNVVMMSYAETDGVVGRPAYVTVEIPGGGRAGEVVLRVRGGTESYIAFSDQPVEVGTEVVVLADRGARSVLVAPL